MTVNGRAFNYDYDGNGNMTGGHDLTNPLTPAERTIQYNAANMPTVITHSIGGTTNVTYDGGGVRAKKSVQGGGTTYYISNEYEIHHGAAIKYIFAGNLRIAQKTAATTHYFHKDHLGSSSTITDSNENIVETTEYMPYGGTRKHTGTEVSNYKFTDQELDPESGLYNYDARMYDPMIGRFITADTIVPRPFDPQSLNRYSYALNNPLIYVDPTGHEPNEDSGDWGDYSDAEGNWGSSSGGGWSGNDGAPAGNNNSDVTYIEVTRKEIPSKVNDWLNNVFKTDFFKTYSYTVNINQDNLTLESFPLTPEEVSSIGISVSTLGYTTSFDSKNGKTHQVSTSMLAASFDVVTGKFGAFEFSCGLGRHLSVGINFDTFGSPVGFSVHVGTPGLSLVGTSFSLPDNSD